MIAGFSTVLRASAADRSALFTTAGNRLGTVPQNTEKDFWVSWTLDSLFNGIEAGGPRLSVQRRNIPLEGLWIDLAFFRGHRHHCLPRRSRSGGYR